MKILNSAEYRKAQKELKLINEIGKSLRKWTNSKLQAKTQEFKDRLANGETLDDIRVEAFAIARESTDRILFKRPFDVQMLGGLVLDYGSVAEMKTGEGKTIASIAPVYLNALTGKGVMVSTVNEYLTVRDANETGRVYKFLKLTIGTNKRELNDDEKREAYACDVTYSVHSEIGFDYLRDNMVKSFEEKVQRGFNFCLIDEVDSILIDESKTPLIISGGSKNPSKLYYVADQFVKSLKKDDYDIDWESKGIQLNDNGTDKANLFFKTENIFSVENSELVSRIQNSLRANLIMKRDADYIVREEKVLIVDAFTGRIMIGRSYSEGLHQAIQAKENVEVEPETVTLSTITYQNLFRMFSKLSGMSGTAKTEEDEFIEIYNMRVHEISTNEPMIRIDQKDEIYASMAAKYKAIVNEIVRINKTEQPILLGTEEVYESETLSKMLKQKNIKHTVLNAKQNQSEAEIIARAGKEFSVTIATNMAGRGTDIKPSKLSIKKGGLYVIGTNKAESRRIDNQLIGRSGRQGDIGISKFFLSLDDKLISRFSNQPKLKKMFSDYGDEKIKSKAVVKALRRAQIKIEGFNFDARKNVLQYDDVIRQQRNLVFAQRDIILSYNDLGEVIYRMMSSIVKDVIADFSNFKKSDGTYNIEKMSTVLNSVWFINAKEKINVKELDGLSMEGLIELISNKLIKTYKEELRHNLKYNLSEVGAHENERSLLLETFDANWTLHIDQMEKLRSSSSLVSYAQKNPYQQYVTQGSKLFKDLLKRISHNTIKALMNNKNAIIFSGEMEID